MLITAEDLKQVDASSVGVSADPFARPLCPVTVDLAGYACTVHFDDGDAAARFAARYADMLTRAPAPHQAFALHDPAAGHVFWKDGGNMFRWPHGPLPPPAIAFLADAVAITACFQDRGDGMLSLHAAALGVPGGVAAIIGDSNAGKTTTAVACARAGMFLYSDERCAVDPQSRVHAFPRALNLRAPGLSLLARDRLASPDPVGDRLRAHAGSDWNDVRITDLFGEQASLQPEALRAVFLLAGAARQPAIERVAAGCASKAAARWAQGAGNGLDKIARLQRLFSGVACYRIVLGTPSASADMIRRVLERHTVRLERTA